MITNTKKLQGKRMFGFSLAEALLAVVILAIAAAGVLIPYTTGAGLRAEGVKRTTASRLAGDLMEQIVHTPFEQIISRYDGYNELLGQIKDADGIVFTDPAYANFSRQANCSYVYVPQESGNTQPVFIRAGVIVYYKTQTLVTLNRLISK